jgi:Taurine catabolism dioxygenase TauD, TfdA family
MSEGMAVMISNDGGLATGGWTGADMAEVPESWQVPMPGEVRDELLRIAAAIPPELVAADPFQPRPAVSASTRSLVGEVRRRLAGEPGFVVLTGFPVEEEPRLVEAAYWALGLIVGAPVREDLGDDDPLIARVENVGRDAAMAGAQGNRLSVALPFHVDRCTDLVGLLCIRPAISGGMSRIVSSKRLNNLLRERHRDLHAELCRPMPFSVPPLRASHETPRWCEIPVFGHVGGDFAASWVRRFIEQTQSVPEAPRLTERQVAAMDAADEALEDPELPLEMHLRPGDVQLINNLHILHTRTAYDDGAAAQGRLLLRLHLAFGGSPALHEGYVPMYGTTAGGTYRGGVWRTADYRRRIGTPLEP